jgi:MFS family permease
MKAKAFVDSLFNGYEETTELADFKEELLGNMNAKIENLVKKGMDEETAFAKASAELGDVSLLANEMSLKKRKEVFEEIYLDMKQYMPVKRVVAYIIFGAVALFGIASALITLFATQYNLTASFGVLVPFLTASITGFTFLGITQELPSMYPVSKKRGAWYSAAAGLISFGLLSMPVVYFGSKIEGFNFDGLVPVISLMIPFILPAIGIFVFLGLTEKDRLKPWAKSFRNKAVESEMAIWNDPVIASRFGMFSGAIWIFAAGLFILLGFLIGFKFSWLVFVFAIAFQLLVQGFMYKQIKK